MWIDLFAEFFATVADVPLVHGHPALPPPPPPAAAAALAPAPLAAAGGARFVGQPVSDDIVGPGLRQAPTMPCRECQSPLHSPWECPLRYARVLREPCPGFDAQGR